MGFFYISRRGGEIIDFDYLRLGAEFGVKSVVRLMKGMPRWNSWREVL